jgi:hypothetical protein
MADNLMMIGVLKALGATLGFAAVVAAIEYAYRRVRARLDTTPKERMAGVEIHRHESGRLAAGAQFGLRWLRNLAILAAFYVFLPLFLTLLPWTEKLAAPLAAYFLAPLASLWTALIEYLPSAAHVLVVVIVARYLLKLLRFVARAVASGRIVVEGFYPDWAVPTYKILRALVVMLVFVDILPTSRAPTPCSSRASPSSWVPW